MSDKHRFGQLDAFRLLTTLVLLAAAPAFDVTKDQLIAHLNAEDAQAILGMFSAAMSGAHQSFGARTHRTA